MRYLFIPELSLQLFAEGGAAAAPSAGEGAGDASGNAEVVAPQQDIPAEKTGVKNAFADVVYGKQTGAPAAEEKGDTDVKNGTDGTVDRKAAFEALIKGEYKDLYDERVRDTLQKRFRSVKDVESKNAEMTSVMELLAERHGVDPTDIKAIEKAVLNDNAYYTEEAMEKGVTVEELKASKKIQRENAALKKQITQMHAREAADRQYSDWMKQAEVVREHYPSFDLRAELANQKFADLIKANIDMKTAYEVLHQDELIPAAMQYTAKTVEKQIAAKVAANGRRPLENGTAARSAGMVKSDVSQLTDGDIDEVMRRVQRGDIISF